ncbi:hypothetical protein [Lutimonas sp.]|uniref:hypothetical protein n=1 Tax=Lutimonas sp. TaxID=1872403 RepID=UPI003D9B7EA6
MKRTIQIIGFLSFLVITSCSSIKVVDAWKNESSVVNQFKEKNVFVVGRTADNTARIAFEEAITNQLRSRGVKATSSFTKVPKIFPNKEMSEERVALMKSLLASEGYDAIVLTVIKEKEQNTRTSSSGIYVGASYGAYYPGHYGNFYNYYSYPYATGNYYNSFGGYVPLGDTTTETYTNYVLETVAYNLGEGDDNQLVAVVTTTLNDPKGAYKTADAYAEKIFESLQ